MKIEIGYQHNFEVRNYSYTDEKVHGIRIAFLSDFHFNRFGRDLLNHIVAKLDTLKPDVILLGGDYADSKHGLYYFSIMIKSLSEYDNVFAISGNHDLRHIEKIKTIVRESNVKWIERESVNFELRGFRIQIDGGVPRDHKTVNDLSILCLHKPIDITLFTGNYNIVFAGHLHGSQIVFWENERGLFPGRLIYKWNRLSAFFGKCQYLISKGLGDTLPIRYNCKRDIILVETVKSP